VTRTRCLACLMGIIILGCNTGSPPAPLAAPAATTPSVAAVPPRTVVPPGTSTPATGVSQPTPSNPPNIPPSTAGTPEIARGASQQEPPAGSKDESSDAPVHVDAAPGAPDQFTAGRQVFASNCARCHPLSGIQPGGPAAAGGPPGPGATGPGRPGAPGGPGAMPGRPMGGGMGRGPALDKVGAKRTRDWIVAHIRNPKGHNPQSRMPGFEGKIKDGDLQALADYLASLK
jgi:mono/diheme cytochrome c family protein